MLPLLVRLDLREVRVEALVQETPGHVGISVGVVNSGGGGGGGEEPRQRLARASLNSIPAGPV